MQETLVKLVEWVESASPELWRIALKQAYVELWQTILGIVICGGAAIGGARFALWCQEKKKAAGSYSDWEIGAGFSWGSTVFLVIIALCLLIIALPRFLNMEYVAIQKLMELAP